jgi:hypothetical protein
MQAYKTAQGHWQINFSEFGKQRTLYLGRDFTSGSADRICRIVSDILSCRKRGDALPLELFRQVESLPARIRKSFERLGLIGGVVNWTLMNLLDLVLLDEVDDLLVLRDLLVTRFGTGRGAA